MAKYNPESLEPRTTNHGSGYYNASAAVREVVEKEWLMFVPPDGRDRVEYARWLFGNRDTPWEHPVQTASPGGHEGRWVDAYVDRLRMLCSKFDSLGYEDRRYIHAAREEGIAWRGDEMKMFVDICEENERMREMGLTKYREQLRENLGKFLRSRKRSSTRTVSSARTASGGAED